MVSYTGVNTEIFTNVVSGITDATSSYAGILSETAVLVDGSGFTANLWPTIRSRHGVQVFPTASETFTAHQRLHSSPEAPTIQPNTEQVSVHVSANTTDAKSEYVTQYDVNPTEDAVKIYAYLPLKFFHEVTGRCLDEEGEPITNARFIGTPQNLGTVGSVDDDGYFRIYLLRVPYDLFFLGVPTSGGGVDLVWYSAEESPTIQGKNNNVDLTFTAESLASPLDTTRQIHFSGA